MRCTVDLGSSARAAMLPRRLPPSACVVPSASSTLRVFSAASMFCRSAWQNTLAQAQRAVMPPSTTSWLPVVNPACSEAR